MNVYGCVGTWLIERNHPCAISLIYLLFYSLYLFHMWFAIKSTVIRTFTKLPCQSSRHTGHYICPFSDSIYSTQLSNERLNKCNVTASSVNPPRCSSCFCHFQSLSYA